MMLKRIKQTLIKLFIKLCDEQLIELVREHKRAMLTYVQTQFIINQA